MIRSSILRLIDNAENKKQKELDLSGNNLREIPPEIGRLTDLAKLDLAFNQLDSLPPEFESLTRLASLNLADNRFSSIPPEVHGLSTLRSLNLSGNRLSMLPPAMGRFSLLESLDLSFNELRELPAELGQLKSLASLKARNNQLVGLPPKLGTLPLILLDISSNRLESLPEELVDLLHLSELLLRDNRFAAFPTMLTRLANLMVFDLEGNQLEKIPGAIGKLGQLRDLFLGRNQLAALPSELGELIRLERLNVDFNQISLLPPEVCRLTNLRKLELRGNQTRRLPCSIGSLTRLEAISLTLNQLEEIPPSVGEMAVLNEINLDSNQLSDLPAELARLQDLRILNLDNNPLNPELSAAYHEGLDAVSRYLGAKARLQVDLNEAKLILVGEGEVGKSSLLAALRREAWIEDRPTTHGIEIKHFEAIDPISDARMTLNGWDFGGQPVYRPTHQLFFSSPAVYLIVWKPREGLSQGFVLDWIELVKNRAPGAKIIIVATHGGPSGRQPDLDRHDILERFGTATIVGFHHVDCRPPNFNKKTGLWTGEDPGVAALREEIAKVAASLPEAKRQVPTHWLLARRELQKRGEAYLDLEEVSRHCRKFEMHSAEADLFVRVSHRLGHLIHYEHDPVLQNIVVLKADWLATAISLVLDDEQTRAEHGLVSSSRLSRIWNDPTRDPQLRYSTRLHPVFLRLMERYDLSYRIAEHSPKPRSGETSLIAQLVCDVRPKSDLQQVWVLQADVRDEERIQICRIVDMKGQSARAEGLFYQLIVRLHRFSLGREDYRRSVHWKRGLVLEDGYNGRALMEQVGSDVSIRVRAPYPDTFLAFLTYEVKWLVANYWEGLRCEVVVPCVDPCGLKEPGLGVFEVQKLVQFKRQGMTQYPCSVPGCYQASSIDSLLRNAASRQRTLAESISNEGLAQILHRLNEMQGDLKNLNRNDNEILSRLAESYDGLLQALTDEARDGPRLFSMEPLEGRLLGRTKWLKKKFRLTLWCEHCRAPLPALNPKGDKSGVYEFEIPRDWFLKAAPLMRSLSVVLSLALPLAATAVLLEDAYYRAVERQLELGRLYSESLLKDFEETDKRPSRYDATQSSASLSANGASLRQLHLWLRKIDPSFGGLTRVWSGPGGYRWVHPKYKEEY